MAKWNPFSRLQLGEQPGTVELAGLVLIGVSLALLSWQSLRGKRPIEPQAGQE